MRIISLLLILLFGGCSSLLFHPDDHRYSKITSTPYRSLHFLSEDHTSLHALWITPESQSQGVVVLAHGNAQNLSAHLIGWMWMVKAGYELFIFDYRGFGASQGEVDLQGSIADTRAALQYAREQTQTPLIVVGQSIGGAIMLNALSTLPDLHVRLCIIDSTYSRLQDIGVEVMQRSMITWPFWWLSYLALSSRYDPIDTLLHVKVPLLFVAGSSDAMILPNHSWQLFETAPSPKMFWLVKGAGHINVFDQPHMQKELLEFLETPHFEADASVMKIYDKIPKTKGLK